MTLTSSYFQYQIRKRRLMSFLPLFTEFYDYGCTLTMRQRDNIVYPICFLTDRVYFKFHIRKSYNTGFFYND